MSQEIEQKDTNKKKKPKRDPWFIYPLKRSGKLKNNIICTLDIETIEWLGPQIPICITFAYESEQSLKYIIVIIDHELLIVDKNKAIKNMWLEFYQKVMDENIGNSLIIYSHNLGAFDGYFIFPSLYDIADSSSNVVPLTDDKNKFILINYTSITEKWDEDIGEMDLTLLNWKFLDSYRLFPASLNDLCKIYGLEGKISQYDNSWNNIELFNDPILLDNFKKYAVNDSMVLLQVLLKARDFYLENYNTDITKSVSTSSLSLLIYRHISQTVPIPILKRELDSLIRESYYGGSSDYYIKYGVNIKYYDINSLYPYAMLKDMPLKYEGVYEDLNIKLDDCFGFIEAVITSPDNIKIPLLPFKHNGKIIHPIGTWKGTYFSEELKAAVEYGYKVEVIKHYKFTRSQDLFKKYIDKFYELKKNAKNPAERYIAKLHLNTLYGMFGRKLDVTICKTATPEEEIDIVSVHPIKNIIQINENLKLFLIYSNLDFELINKLNVKLDLNILKQSRDIVKSNVAIASAITAYARIEMMKYKNMIKI